jgi:hypothetical protein
VVDIYTSRLTTATRKVAGRIERVAARTESSSGCAVRAARQLRKSGRPDDARRRTLR